MSETANQSIQPANRPIQDLTIWIVALGGLLILLGLGAIAVPFLMPGAVVSALAWVLLLGGVLRIVYAFQSRPSPGFWLKMSVGLLNEVASLLLFTRLMEPYLSLSVLLGVTILLKGLLEIAIFFQLQPGSSRNWVIISGLFSSALGLLLITNLKSGAAWLLGLLVGLSLIATGLWFIMLSLWIEEAASDQSQPSLNQLAQSQRQEKLLRLKFWRKSSHKQAK